MSDRPRIKTRHPGVMYRERPDGSKQYCIWFEGTDGKGHFKNVPGNEGDAKRARAKIVNDMAHGQKIAPSRTLFQDFAWAWLEEQQNLSPKTVETYRTAIKCHLVPKLGRLRLSEVDVDRVAGLISGMQKEGLSAWTIKTTLSPLSRIMVTATRRGYASVNPVAQLDKSERPKGDAARMNILDTDEIKLLLSHSMNHRPLFATALFTGLRASELCALSWEDVDWEEGFIHVRGTKTQAAVREVVLMPDLQQILAAHSLESQTSLVFPAARGGRMDRRVVWRALQAALERAGIEKRVRFHDLRHTYASMLISGGFQPVYVAEQMGHSNASITLKTYAKLFDRKKRREEAREMMTTAFGGVLG